MKFSGICSALLCSVLSCPCLLSGQTPVPTSVPAATDQLYPDQGYVSSTRYVNRYFGFAFDLPPDARLRPVPRPVAGDGRIQLLELAGPAPVDALVSISAFPLRPQSALDAKAILRRLLDQELYTGVEELHGLTKSTFGGHQFYLYETRRGIEQHMLLATNFDGYVLQVLLAGHNESVLKAMESSFQHLVFFPPSEARHQAGADAQEYEGPAISAHRLAMLQADPPAKHIDPGQVEGDVYSNQGLGFTYRIPLGWIREAEGALQPALERSQPAGDTVESFFDGTDPNSGRVERQLMKACRRTLFSAWAKRPRPDGQISYDDFGEITISAAAMACFPGVSFPADATDQLGFRNFLMQFRLTNPILRDMRDAKIVSSNGTVVLYLHGTVAFQPDDDKLSRRLSVAMAVTARRGYLLSWFFAAPHDSELRSLLEQRVAFDPEPLTREASAKPSNQGVQPAASLQLVPGTTAQSAAPPADAASASIPGGGSGASPGAANTQEAAPTPAPATDSSSRPTLLRPGETMQDQQGKGQPIPKH